MSVNSHLTSLASDLVLSSDETANIRTSLANLTSKLDSYFGEKVTNRFQFGSSTRGTILPRKADERSDVDCMVVFNTSEGEKKPQAYLDRLRNFVNYHYSSSSIKQSHPTIVLSLKHIHFELVPAIEGMWSGLQIPSPSSDWNDWMSTDPSSAKQELQDKNKSNDYRINPLVRIIKFWNARNGYPFSSYSIEKYIIESSFWGDYALKDYFYSFWSGMSYNWGDSQSLKNKVDKAKKHAETAKEYETSNMPVSAESEIEKMVPSL